MIRKILNHIKNASTPIFIIESTLLAFFLKFMVLVPTTAILTKIGYENLVSQADKNQVPTNLITMIVAIFIMPPIETIIGQWIPIKIASIFSKKNSFIIIFSAFTFMLLHYTSVAFFPGAFVMGLVFSWCWQQKAKDNRRKAFFTTTAIHSLHNLLAILISVF